MESETLTSFLGSLDKPSKFKSRPVLCFETDTLTVYIENESSYAERLDRYLTVFKSFDSQEFVGFELKGVLKLLRDLGGMIRVKAETPKVHVELVLLAYLREARGTKNSESYDRLLDRVRGIDANIPLRIPDRGRNRVQGGVIPTH